MRRRAPIVAGLCLCVSGLAAAGQQNDTPATVRVRVSMGDSPAVGALVTLDGAGGGGAKHQAFTDETGACEFNVARGVGYALQVTKSAYFVSTGSDEKIFVTAGHTKTVHVSMVKGGVITGRLLDAEGDALAGIPVTALKSDAGARNFRPPPKAESNVTSVSDDQGIFRIYGLRAGSYVVALNAQRDLTARKFIPATYYPGRTEPRQATPVFVGQSQEVALPDMRLADSPASGRALTGTVSVAGGEALPGATVSLARAGDPTVSDQTLTDGDGQFTFEGLAPGDYVVSAGVRDGHYYRGEAKVAVKDLQVSKVTLRLDEHPLVEGAVFLLRGAEVEVLPDFALTLTSPAVGHKVRAVSGPTGAFSVRTGRDGEFRWELPGLDGNTYVKQVVINGKDVTGEVVKVGRGAKLTDVKVFVSTGAAAVEGRFDGDASPGCAGFTVFAVPLAVHNSSSGARPTPADFCAGKTFGIRSLAPGEYYIVALATSVFAKPGRRNMTGADTNSHNDAESIVAHSRLRPSDAVTLRPGRTSVEQPHLINTGMNLNQ